MARSLVEYIIKVRSESDLDTLIPELESWNIQVIYTYKRVFPGICVLMTGLLVKWYKNDPRIESIEESGVFQHFSVQENAPSHLDRLDQRELPLSGNFTYALDGTDVIAYILDSGGTFRGDNIDGALRGFDHEEFGGRVTPIPDPTNTSRAFDPFFDGLADSVKKNNPRGFDGLGHGTHVAGIVGSATYGAAKNVELRTAKIFGSTGSTTGGTIIAGIDAILDDHADLGSPLAVCNMSFGGDVGVGASETSIETAVLSLISAGIICVVAAGNSGKNAETTQPARLAEVITVGASDKNDEMANFSNFEDLEDIVAPEEFGFAGSTLSNFGSVVDIFAVGVNVLSTWYNTPIAVNTLSGTSMATPGVAGVVALFIENSPGSTPATIKTDLLTNATSGELTLTDDAITAGTPNTLVYSTFVDFVVEWITDPGELGPISEARPVSIQLEAQVFSGLGVVFSLLSGTLPVGVTLDGNAGIISGTMPFVSSDEIFNFTIRAFDGSLASPIFADQNFSLTVVDDNLPPTWATSRDLGEIEEGNDFQIQFAAVSNNDLPTSSLIYSVVGTLINNWTLTTDGLLEGRTPQNINTDFKVGFTLSVTDGLTSAERTFNILIKQRLDFLPPTEPEWITPIGNIGTAIEGEVFAFFLEAIDNDGIPQPITFHLQLATDDSQFGPFGELPPGLGLIESTGEISGIVSGISTDEDFEFAVFVTDSANTVARLFEITVLAEPENLPPVWETDSGNVGIFDSLVNSSTEVIANDPDSGPSPLAYTIASGPLPPGMSLDFNTGQIDGVPESVNEDTLFPFIIRVSDGLDSVRRTFSITINRVNVGPEWISEGLIASINEGEILDLQLEATDANNDELTFTLINGTLPPTLVLSEDGIISGPILDVGADTVFVFTVEVDDSKSNPVGEEITVAREFSIEIIDGALNPNVGPVWVTSEGALAQATEGQQYYDQVKATDPDGNPNPIIYFVSAGVFPPGLALNQNTGEISGILITDDNIVDDTFEFIIKAFDGLDFSECIFSIEVIDIGDDNNPPIWITPAGSLGSFNEAAPLILPLSAIDPDEDPITFSKIAGTFPPGLIIDENTGVISGTPAQVGSNTEYFFIIRVEDDKGKFTDRSFSIEIIDTANIPPLWNTASGSIAIINEGEAFSFPLMATDPDVSPNPTLQYELTDEVLPLGLILNPATGEISGTPASVVSDTIFNFEITVDDGLAFVPQSFSITIINVPVFAGTTGNLVVPLLGSLRNEWRRWNTDTLIVDDDIFEIADPAFGRLTEPVVFVVSNLHTDDPDIVFNSFGLHHNTFKTLITVPDFAVVRDAFGTIIYEMVYLKIKDPQAGSDFDITNIPTPSALDTNGIEEYTSKNFFHLREEILTGIDNDDELPAWMTSEQIAGDASSVIGYIPAIEVAYVKPGKGQDITGVINEITTTLITLPSSETTFDIIDTIITTIFDTSTTTFDKTAGTLLIINTGIGFQFAGRQFIIDRYILDSSIGDQTYIKFNSDSPNPIWLTLPGSLESFLDGSLASTNVLALSPPASSLNYSVVYGNLPGGMSLNATTGEISGTILIPGFVSPTEFPFVIRAIDAFSNFTDRTFSIIITN